ncbi:MAG: peptidylprolyl isomerase [Leadbetterella sp.]
MKRLVVYLFIAVLVSACEIIKSKIPIRKPIQAITPTETPLVVAPPVLTMGKLELNKTDFMDQIQYSVGLDTLSATKAIESFVNRKRWIAEAEHRGYDTVQSFKEEYDTYKKIHLAELNFDKNEINRLAEEAYQFYQKEINCSTIYLPISPYASAADTLALYKKMLDLRAYALKNKNFGILAREWSKDFKTKEKQGNLGWMSVFNLIYPLEKVAFNTPVDSISRPIRTKLGYYLIKTNGVRKNSGRVSVKQIYKYLPNDISARDYERAFKSLDSLRKKIKTDSDFNYGVQKYSDDKASKNSNGAMPIFGIGNRMEQVFEEAAFKLDINEVSTPVKTSSGLSVMKLIEKLPPMSKTTFMDSYKREFVSNSRAEHLKSIRINKIKTQYNFIQYKEILDAASSYADERLETRNWTIKGGDFNTFILFSIGKRKVTVNELYKYILERQSFEKWPSTYKYKEIYGLFYDNFLQKTLIEVDENEMLKFQKENLSLLDKTREDLLIGRLKEDVVIRAAMDTAAIHRYFDENSNLFMHRESSQIIRAIFNDDQVYKKFTEIRDKGEPYPLKKGIKPMYFPRNETLLTVENKKTLDKLAGYLKKNSGYIVEVTANCDSREATTVASSRLKAVVDYLVSQGLPITRIQEKNNENKVLVDRFDFVKNQRVTFQFFTKFESDLIKVFNDRNPGSIAVKTESMDRDEFQKTIGLKWQNQSGRTVTNGKTEEYTIKIIRGKKTFREAKYDALSKYQQHLENRFVQSLKNKYTANYNLNELIQLVNELKKP